MNVDEATIARIDHLVAEHKPFLRRHTVHWVALSVGLAALEQQPELLVQFLERQATS